ncbi:MAG: PAS domain S-box protein, partial [Dehalococcoidia bacterium]|nr:PAS domain S-box protein [Dehalococcoidia bacterium]
RKRADGTEIPVSLLGAPVIVEGKQVGILGIYRDITERKNAEEELRGSRQQLRELAAHLQGVRERERTSIARELHDEMGQTLTALKMDLSWLNKRLPRDETLLLDKIKAMVKLTDATIRAVKRISAELRPGILDDLGLTAAIEWETEEFQKRTGIKCELSMDEELIVLEQDRSTAIFRIFQEALTNVSRHARANRVKASLREEAGGLVLRVVDDGKGITEKQASHPRSFGLIGMRERTLAMGGEFGIEGVAGEGTTLTVRLPLRREGETP